MTYLGFAGSNAPDSSYTWFEFVYKSQLFGKFLQK